MFKWIKNINIIEWFVVSLIVLTLFLIILMPIISKDYKSDYTILRENNKMLHELVDTNRRLHEDDALYD